jgi:hypothetical protein
VVFSMLGISTNIKEGRISSPLLFQVEFVIEYNLLHLVLYVWNFLRNIHKVCNLMAQAVVVPLVITWWSLSWHMDIICLCGLRMVMSVPIVPCTEWLVVLHKLCRNVIETKIRIYSMSDTSVWIICSKAVRVPFTDYSLWPVSIWN